MAALAVQNFVSAAVGIAVAVALIRGFARHTSKTIGNFWVDVTRCTLYILLPDLDRRRAVLRLAGIDSELQGARHGADAGRRISDDRAGPAGLAARRSRCWEPMAADTSTRIRRILTKIRRRFRISSDAVDLRARRRPDVHVREDGSGYAAGLGDIRNHVGAVPRSAPSSATGPSRAETR